MMRDPIDGPVDLTPNPSDRLLLLAPHPDDESLAAGGLVALAAARGAAVRILYVTRGENNPWAQRVRERRLRVGPKDRVRWGERRWGEALSALTRLGVPAECARCLGLPDQGLSDLLFRRDPTLLAALEEEIARWRPTVVLAPAIWDGHPDHSATGLVARLARIPEGVGAPLVLQYVVHRRTEPDQAGGVRVRLDERMRRLKREAVLCHRSQAALRGGFLLRFVRDEERFTPLEPGVAEELPHPVRSAVVEDGLLHIEIARPLPSGLGRPVLALLAGGSADESGARDVGAAPRGGAARWSTLWMELDLARGVGIARPGRKDRPPARVPLGLTSARIRIETPLPGGLFPGQATAVFANVIRPGMRRVGFFDATGWKMLHAAAPPAPRAPEFLDSAPEREDARTGANSLAEVVAAQGFEPRTKGL